VAKAAKRLKKKTGIELKPAEAMVVTMSPEYEAAYKARIAEEGKLRSQAPREPHPKILIQTILQRHLTPFLKEKGFRKKGRHFWRIEGDIIDLIDLQSSQFNDAWQSKFTINLGVGWQSIQQVISGPCALELPPKACIFQHRLTPDMQKKADHWWYVRSDTDAGRLARELLSMLESKGFAWMESRRDREIVRKHVIEHWPSHTKKFEAILSTKGKKK